MTHFGGIRSTILPECEQLLHGVNQHSTWAMVHASAPLRQDKDFVLSMVAQDGNALLYVTDDLKGDRDVVMTAVTQNGHALRHAAIDLLHDREFVLDAVQASGEAFFVAPQALREEPEFVYAAARRGATLEAVPAKFRPEVTKQRLWAARRAELMEEIRVSIETEDRVRLLKAIEDSEAHLMELSDLEEALDAAAQLNKFGDIRSLWEPLKVQGEASQPTVVLLKGSWILQYASEGSRFPRRQDLPDGATWSIADLRREIEEYEYQGRDRRPPKVIVISHVWFRREHPDPHGENMKLLASLIERRFEDLPSGSDLAVFIDYCSLFQEPRAEEEEVLFQEAVREVSLWYAHEKTEKWLLTATPDSCSLPSDLVSAASTGDALPVVPYNDRGWTTLERAIADLAISDGAQQHGVLDIGRLKALTAGMTGTHELPHWPDIQRRCSNDCVNERLPPQIPDIFCAELAQKHFSDQADVELVQNIYRYSYSEEIKGAQVLLFGGLSWSDAEANLIADAIYTCDSLQTITLDGNRFTDAGVKVLMDALCTREHLEDVSFRNNNIGDEGARYVASRMYECKLLKKMDLGCNMFGNPGVDCFTKMLNQGRHPSLQALHLAGNEIGSHTRRQLIMKIRDVHGDNFVVNA